MAWLEKLNSAANVKSEDVTAHYPFAEERVYWQLDLDGRDAVEGLARYYVHNAYPGFFGSKIIEQLEEQRQKDVGSVAVYLAKDGHSDIAYAFIAKDSGFMPTLP